MGFEGFVFVGVKYMCRTWRGQTRYLVGYLWRTGECTDLMQDAWHKYGGGGGGGGVGDMKSNETRG